MPNKPAPQNHIFTMKLLVQILIIAIALVAVWTGVNIVQDWFLGVADTVDAAYQPTAS